MKRRKVESSQIESIGWDNNVLEVEFKAKPGKVGSVYQYFDVPSTVFARVFLSPSLFGELVKNSGYEYSKLEN